jgi:hypothetical protein
MYIEKQQENRDYLPRFLAVFLGLGVNGVGGVPSIRRSTSSARGCDNSRFGFRSLMIWA